jgi:chromosome partitioning protein
VKQAIVLAVANPKGGVGKTTTAVNLAASLAVLDRRILLFDLDPQGSAAQCLGISHSDVRGGSYDVFVRGEAPAPFTLEVGRIPLSILPANVWTQDEEEAYVRAVRSEVLVRALEGVRRFYDYVILDNPPMLGSVTMASLMASDSLLVPVQCEELPVKALGRLMTLHRKVLSQGNPELCLEGVLLTMVDGRTMMSARIINLMRRNFGSLLFRTMIPRSVDLARSVQAGTPLLLTNAASRGAQSYLNLATELVHRQSQRLAS